MKRLFVLLICLSFLSINLKAQDSTQTSKSYEKLFSAEDLALLDEYEDTLALLAYAVINDSLPENRFGTCRELIKRLVKALKIENSFHYPFERLRSVSIQYPQDSSFRIFTWQLYVDVNDYRYYGAIQMNNSELELFPLIDRSFNVEDVEQGILSADKWYGSIYYNLKQAEGPNGKYYLLFGFDGYEFFHKRKLVDVLTFDEAGKPVFGAPVFVKTEEGKPPATFNRLMIQYSASTSVRMNYDESLGMIIYDHLIEGQGQYNEGPTKFPDGSYEAFKLEEGHWRYVTKVFHQVSDEAPRPFPRLDTDKKDLFGN